MVRRVLPQRDGFGQTPEHLPPPKTSSRTFLFSVLLAAAAVFVGTASAGVLDQSQPSIRHAGGFVSDDSHKAQSFTDGITGGLDQVDLAISRPASDVLIPLTVQIRAFSGGVPSGPALVSTIVAAGSVPVEFNPSGFVAVPLVPPVPVTAGAQYAIVLSTSPCGNFFNCYDWAFGTFPDPYPAGAALFSTDAGASWGPHTGEDFGFKTYVVPDQPMSRAQCKKGGWKQFKKPSFRNQGQCVAFVNHHNGKGKDDEKSNGTKKKGKKK